MSLIGVINSDKALNKLIEKELTPQKHRYDVITFHDDIDEILEYLNFDMPEIVIINFSDNKLNKKYLINQIIADNWLHNFGIVGIYDKSSDNEKRLFEKLKSINLLNLFDYTTIKTNLSKTINIIRANRQVIFQREIADKLVDNISGTFEIDNDILAVPCYVNMLAIFLYNKGYVDEEMKINITIALRELLLNGIEHGNCKITYNEKSAHLENGGAAYELVAKKCKDPEVASKKVFLEYNIKHNGSAFKIIDEGDGFDVKRYQEWLKNKNPHTLLGRGIMMARSLGKKLSYNSKGNEATLSIEHKNAPVLSPAGFSKEEAMLFKKGDIVFREGEGSNFIYYVLSGKYSVFHKKKHIGFITAADVFMGEMSFLLNNQRSATVRTEEAGKLLKISKRSFISVIKKYPHYGVFLSRLIARKLVRTNSATARMMVKLASN